MTILSEGAYAEVCESMGLLNRAETHLRHMESRLKQCKISIDPDSLKHISFYLDKIHAQLEPLPLAHAEARDAHKAGK